MKYAGKIARSPPFPSPFPPLSRLPPSLLFPPSPFPPPLSTHQALTGILIIELPKVRYPGILIIDATPQTPMTLGGSRPVNPSQVERPLGLFSQHD